jgi:hypothetical protein
VPKLVCGWAGARTLSSRGEQGSIYPQPLFPTD